MATPALIPQHVDDSECVTRVQGCLCGKQDYFRASYRLGSDWSDSPSPGSVLSDVVSLVQANHGLYVHTHVHVALITLRHTGPLTPCAQGCSFDRANFALGSTVSICSSVESLIFLGFAVVPPRKSFPKLCMNSSQMLLGHANLSSQRFVGV